MTRRRVLLLSAALALTGAGANSPAPKAESGRIAGTVEISTALATRRPRFRIYADPGQGAVPPAAQRTDVASELRNVVVYLETDPALTADSARADAMRRGVMAQSDERFDPHVLTVLQGARVDFPNHDDVYHNVFSLSSVRSFDLGRYRKGSSKAVAFPKTGIAQVFCHIHSDMSAVVLVLPNPFFAVPGVAGAYAVEDVPPGEYTIVGWHERTRPVARRVRVVAGQTTTINFSLPLEQRTAP